MDLTSSERRIHQSFEDAREREAEGTEPEVACAECEESLDGTEPHVLAGVTYCASCALHRAAFMFHDLDILWPGRSAADRLEVLEVMGAAANELESALRTELRRKAG